MFENEQKNLKLSDIMNKISKSVTSEFPLPVWIEAEITSINKQSSTGHYYLDLIESDSKGNEICKTKASIWSSKVPSVIDKFKKNTGTDLKSGIKVLVRCKIAFHQKYQLSMSIEDINTEFTLGGMELKVKEIMARLDKEGLTNKNKVLKTPFDFFRLAVVSPSGAAGLGDFKKDADILEKYGICNFDYYEATFQGNDTNKSVTNAIQMALKNYVNYDALIVIRGGGAKTDLHYLNEYDIAVAICTSKIPVFVGVGHERDKGVLDYVANTSFDTPSKVIGHIFSVVVNNSTIMNSYLKSIENNANNFVTKTKLEVENSIDIVKIYSNKNIESFKEKINFYINNIEKDSKNNLLNFEKEALNTHNNAIIYSKNIIDNVRKDTNENFNNILDKSRNIINMTLKEIENLDEIISGYNPEYILKIGFLLAKKKGKTITNCSDLVIGDELDLKFKDGSITVKIIGDK